MESNLPVVVHLIYRFDIGGLERVMINCINATKGQVRHIIISLTEVSDFADHLDAAVEIHHLNKNPGKDLAIHWRLFKLLRKIKPDILHSYNLATIEYQLVAKLAGVKGSLHAEHGRDVSDPLGLNSKHNFLRKILSPMIDYFVPVSTDLSQWLIKTVNINASKVILIRNGINIGQFFRARKQDSTVNFIHVARLDKVKDQAGLITAFHLLIQELALKPIDTRLTIVGDGEEMANLQALTCQLMIQDYVEFTGARNDIPELMSKADVFVLSSIAEGIPMTVLEAMASNLAVVSTNVGGLSELIQENFNGKLVVKQQPKALADAMATYIKHKNLVEEHGAHAKKFVIEKYDETLMVDEYLTLYKSLLRPS